MEDIPQPARDAYSPGDRVRVHIGPDDSDAEHHDRDCRVVEVLTDDLDLETGRDTDAYSYRVEDVTTGEKLPVLFRHSDLVPIDE
jgi:hypothetical protein